MPGDNNPPLILNHWEDSDGAILITKKHMDEFMRNQGLKQVLSAKDISLMGIGISLSGLVSFWNMSLKSIGPSGLFLGLIFFTLLYFVVIWAMYNLAKVIPYAGGPYGYTRLVFGRFVSFLVGMITVWELIFLSALLVRMINEYFKVIYPDHPAVVYSSIIVITIILFHAIDIKLSSFINYLLTGLAISVIALFCIGTVDYIDINKFLATPLFPAEVKGLVYVLPYIMWLFIGIEGISVAGEETSISETRVAFGFIFSLVSVSIFSTIVLILATTVVDYSFVANQSFPLNSVLRVVQGNDHVLLATIGFLGSSPLIAGLLGTVYGYSRQIFALSRAGYLPEFLSRLHHSRQTPVYALAIPVVICWLLANYASLNILLNATVLMALLIYLAILVAYIKLCGLDTDLFISSQITCPKVLVLSAITVMTVIFLVLSFLYLQAFYIVVLICLLAFIYYKFWAQYHIREEAPEESKAVCVEQKRRVELH